MKIVKTVFAVLITLILMLSFTGCGGVDYEPLELVPSSSQMLMNMRVSEAVRDYQIYAALDGNEAIKEWFDNAKEEFYSNTHMDLNDISEVMVFALEGSGDAMDETGSFGVIITGNFADNDFLDSISKSSEANSNSEKYGDFTIYAVGEDEDAVLVKMSNTMLMIGTVDAVKMSLDVAAGEAEALSGTLLDAYDELGDVMMRMVATIPDETADAIAEDETMSMMPVGLESFSDMDTMGMSVAMTTQALILNMDLGFSESGSAGKAAESMENLLGFMGMMSTEQEVTDFIERIEITASSTTMHITYEMTLGELADILQSMEEGMGDMSEGGPFNGFDVPGQE